MLFYNFKIIHTHKTKEKFSVPTIVSPENVELHKVLKTNTGGWQRTSNPWDKPHLMHDLLVFANYLLSIGYNWKYERNFPDLLNILFLLETGGSACLVREPKPPPHLSVSMKLCPGERLSTINEAAPGFLFCSCVLSAQPLWELSRAARVLRARFCIPGLLASGQQRLSLPPRTHLHLQMSRDVALTE